MSVSIVLFVYLLATVSSQSGCGNKTYYFGPSGSFASPNYPGNYYNNLNCNTYVNASTGSSFSFIFKSFVTEKSIDFVTISCQTNSSFSALTFSGQSLPAPVLVPWCSQARVNFRTDHSITYRGFSLDYFVSFEGTTSVASNVSLTETRSVASTTAFTQTMTTPTLTSRGTSTEARTTDFTTGVTPPTLTPTDCGETSYYGPSGVISSPNYPGSYSNYDSCNYSISASSSLSSIAIIFEAFNTEQCCDYVTFTCPTNSSRPTVSFSGSALPQPISIPWCSKAAVNFTTNNSTVSTGFRLDYHISLGGCGETIHTGSHGYISSPNYPNSYGNNQNCSNIVWAGEKSSFSIIFQYIHLEGCCDFVQLSCLDNAEYGSYRFTGSSIPNKQDIHQCSQLLIWFYTDNTVTLSGFNLEYFVTPKSDN